MARPTGYKPEYAKQAAKLAKLAATDYEIADFFDVTVKCFYDWKNRYPKFSEAIKTPKDTADNRVVRSLFQRAMGYEREAEKIVVVDKQIVKATYREYVPPDSTAQIFWLKNRKPAEWRDRKELAGDPNAPIAFVSSIPRPKE